MQIVKEYESANAMPFINRYEDIQGGVSISIADLDATTLELAAGTVIGEATDGSGVFHVVKTALLHANATNTAVVYQVKKNHNFKVGDILTTKDVASCRAYAITVVDKTTSDVYDILTVGTTLGVAMTAANGVVLNQAAAQDAAGGASLWLWNPKAILGENISWVAGGSAWGSGVVRGTLKESLLPYSINSTMKTALSARIMFI